MKTIIAGCRDCCDPSFLLEALDACGWTPTEVISGNARGADKLGEQWAVSNGLPLRLFPADWHTHGKAAGPIRNALMADNAEALIALWDYDSRGTKNMIETARRKQIRVYVHDLRQPPEGIK